MSDAAPPKSPSTDDTFVNVTAYLTDEFLYYEHWRGVQYLHGEPEPVSDFVRPALLVVCRDEAEREFIHKYLSGDTKQEKQANELDACAELALAAAERVQERAYGDARGRDITDTVIMRQELMKLRMLLAGG